MVVEAFSVIINIFVGLSISSSFLCYMSNSLLTFSKKLYRLPAVVNYTASRQKVVVFLAAAFLIYKEISAERTLILQA